jgi:hypothetical protein
MMEGAEPVVDGSGVFDLEACIEAHELSEREAELLRHRDWRGLADAEATVHGLLRLGAALNISAAAIGREIQHFDRELYWALRAEDTQGNALFTIFRRPLGVGIQSPRQLSTRLEGWPSSLAMCHDFAWRRPHTSRVLWAMRRRC